LIGLIETHREQLVDMCRRYRVRRLELFGSAATGSFDPAHSDMDFLVEFQPMSPTDHGSSYFSLWEGLEALFGVPVDLVELPAVENPYFLRGIARSRTVLYAA
jgi:predicted nucleotidyltransferase